MARRVNMHLDEAFAAQIEAQKPKSLALAAFCALLIEQALDDPLPSRMITGKGGRGVGVSEQEASNNQQPQTENQQPSSNSSLDREELEESNPKTKTRARAKSPHSLRLIDPDLVPSDLLDCQQLLPEWWGVKKGVRSEGVWNRVCDKLRQWTPEQRREALSRAIAGGWGDVFDPPSKPKRNDDFDWNQLTGLSI
jgi:hypothetical protein